VTQLRALDLFCGAGGATKGLQRAGFHVTGVDIRPQPRYCGDAFAQADALNPPFDLRQFDFIWASPPCQFASQATRTSPVKRDHRNLIPQTRGLLLASGAFYAIENVPEAAPHLRHPIRLCGTSFRLPGLQRHRFFELGGFMLLEPPCEHHLNSERKYPANRSGRTQMAKVVSVAGHGGTSTPGHGGKASVAVWREAMGIDWMARDELAQAIPPAYSEFIGRAAIAPITQARAA
jgi:DNA (cytosine-5)-methyltransferase 1